MDFDVVSMKKRAEGIIQGIKPSPILVAIIVLIATYVSYWIEGKSMSDGSGLFIFLAIVAFLFNSLIRIGYSWYALKGAREDNPGVADVFGAFTQYQVKSIMVVIIKFIITGVMFCLFFVPVIIAFYWFRPIYYIIQDNPGLSAFAMIRKSIKMMKGHKLELFKIDLSFIGWYILVLVTCGITSIYVIPYAGITYAEYYDYLKGQEELFNN